MSAQSADGGFLSRVPHEPAAAFCQNLSRGYDSQFSGGTAPSATGFTAPSVPCKNGNLPLRIYPNTWIRRKNSCGRPNTQSVTSR